MIKIILGFIIGSFLVSLIWFSYWWYSGIEKINTPESSIVEKKIIEKPLEKFTFSRLANEIFEPDKIEIKEEIEKTTKYASNKFVYYWQGRKISGLVNTPIGTQTNYPVIIMIRGYAPVQYYQTGFGTKNVARQLAENGFITIAPDFLGYADSDKPENDVWWERFSKPAQVLQLLTSLENFDKADLTKIGFWGHSNGGQISLSILEITGKEYPTSLWAPVSSPFPYSILYFTDTDEDEGLKLRHSLSLLEWRYDVREFSVTQNLNLIKAPINLHQGGKDPDVPKIWSDRLFQKLEKNNNESVYNYYPNSDHNMRPDWEQAVKSDLEFFRKYLVNNY